MIDQVLRPYEATGTIIVAYIPLFIFLGVSEIKYSELNGGSPIRVAVQSTA